MEAEKIEVRCPFIDMVRDYFPIVPLIIPLLPIAVLIGCLAWHLHRITASLERQEELLEQIIIDVRRLG